MEEILVTGGTGLLGREIVRQLVLKNRDVNILSRDKAAVLSSGANIVTGDLSTGEGLKEAVEKADIVIHCASNPKDAATVDIRGTENLLKRADRVNLSQLVYISIVGVDKTDYPYYRAKKAVEDMILRSGTPCTILRTTQFHEFVLNMIRHYISKGSRPVPIPKGMYFQSAGLQEVAEKLILEAFSEPKGLLPDFGGPEVLSFEEMFDKYVSVNQGSITRQPDPVSDQRIELFRSGVNICPENATGRCTWNNFLQDAIMKR